ncbi:MAG TPA: aldehyde ferredoxin oxidoreductase C-terminal domain-containing protein, partial [Candidatus Lokiarchaeia archaeon]|nr:aldehyde ferredoxin oxidoreductase C-terminal domain-containing protein [Candidatus Lokiarchaeia archaeon]
AARSGLGAVMGSKKLKAIAISKIGTVPVADKKALAEITKTYNNRLNKKPGAFYKILSNSMPKLAKLLRWVKMPLAGPAKLMFEVYHNYGTSSVNSVSSEIGDSPVKNWGGIGYIDFPQAKARNIAGQKFIKYKVKSYGCATCPVQCGAILSAPDIDPNLQETHRPEYETSCMFGTLCLNDDLKSILKLNEMCNRAGIDSISTGSSVAFAIECFENGILTVEDTGGFELHWGDADAIIKLTEMIISRKGLGDILADGTKRAAERIGKGSEKYGIHAGGEELPAHDPRLAPSLALSFTTDPTPGRHTTASINFAEIGPINDYLPGVKVPKGDKKDFAKLAEGQKVITGIQQSFCSLGLCMFTTLFGSFPLLELVEAATGWKITPEELIKTGWRIQSMRLAFSLREGVNPYTTTLPGRAWGEIPAEKGPHKGKTIDYKEMNRRYYEAMGWDSITGIPTKESLEAVGLGALYEDIVQ